MGSVRVHRLLEHDLVVPAAVGSLKDVGCGRVDEFVAENACSCWDVSGGGQAAGASSVGFVDNDTF